MSFDSFAKSASGVAGDGWFFVLSVVLTVVWLASGFWLGFNESWNFWANTSTTVLTWLLVILVQNSQNRDTAALQLKLDEVVRAIPAARDEFRGIEELPAAEQSRMKET